MSVSVCVCVCVWVSVRVSVCECVGVGVCVKCVRGEVYCQRIDNYTLLSTNQEFIRTNLIVHYDNTGIDGPHIRWVPMAITGQPVYTNQSSSHASDYSA